jgi:hypothetical protein
MLAVVLTDILQVHNDDISQILILNKKSISNYENQLFQTELEKFRPHQNRLLQANHKQSSLMKELTATFNSLLQDKRVRAEQSKYESIQRQRATVVNRYKRAYQEFLDLEAGLQSAKRWYTEMKETVDSLEQNVETFVNNRRAEGAQLLNHIEQDKGKQAEIERERLRGLMERMSMDPSASPGPNPGTRPVPSPLNFTQNNSAYQAPQSNTPRYPQASFTGQYQVSASSPAPTQTTFPSYSSPPPNSSFNSTPQPQNQQYGQPAYNPSNWGRNPGPTSPPPTQTSFNMGGRGPASPPPTQTSFSQHQYSTYGNPQAQQPHPQQQQPQPQQQQQQPQSQYVPPGFVPPPPPPGPPPLGPQQTMHYSQQQPPPQQEYPYGQPQSAGPQSAMPRSAHPQQGQNDPWAGLSQWK